MHEVLTIQFGQQANYVGTHFWNLQESYFTYAGEEDSIVNHDISFCPGIGADGSDTYTPRTLIYDLKDAFGTLRRENALYELQDSLNPAQRAPWDRSPSSVRLPTIPQSSYQTALNLGTERPQLTAETVRFWSDYTHVFYHPRSIVQLNEYESSSSLMPFERWKTGDELFVSMDREHDFLDRDLRPFLEACDHLQGIQIFSGTDDVWGGFASKYLERISDDLGKSCRWVFGLQDSHRATRERRALRASNVAQSLHALNQFASLHIPVTNMPNPSPAYLHFQPGSKWHTSALQCVAIESITLPTRLRGTESAQSTFENLEAVLNGDGKRRIAACAFSVTCEQRSDQSNGHTDSRMMNGNGTNLDVGFQTEYDIGLFPDTGTDSSDRRRARRARLFSNFEIVRDRTLNSDAESTNSHRRRHQADESTRVSCHFCELYFPVLSSFPQIFRFPGSARRLEVIASLSTSKDIASHIRNIESSARRIFGVDEREAFCDEIAAMADEYEEGWNSNDDSEDD